MSKKWMILLVIIGLLLPVASVGAASPPPADETVLKDKIESATISLDELTWTKVDERTSQGGSHILGLDTSGCKTNTLWTSNALVIDNKYAHADAVFNRCEHKNQAGYYYIFGVSTAYTKKRALPRDLTGLKIRANNFSSGTKIADRNPAATYNASSDPVNVRFGIGYGGASAGVSFPLYKDKVTPTTDFGNVSYQTKWSGLKAAWPWANSVTVSNEWVMLVQSSSTPSFSMSLTVYYTSW